MRPPDAEPSASPGQICLIAECASVQPEANAACTRRPRSGTPGTPVLQDLLHGSRLGARCLGRYYRGGCGFGRRLSGQHGLRPAGAGPVHHRHHVAVAELASGADAGAHRARNHDDGDCRRLSRLRVAGGMGFGRVGHSILADSARYQALYDEAIAWLDGHGISVAGLWSEHFNLAWVLGWVAQVTDGGVARVV